MPALTSGSTIVNDYTALLSATSWTSGLAGHAAVVTYSFATAPASYVQAVYPVAADTFRPLSSSEQDTVRAAIAQWAAVSGIQFHETRATPGDLAFAAYDLTALDIPDLVGIGNNPATGLYIDAAGHPQAYDTFLPLAGDVLLDSAYTTANPTDLLHTVLREIGNALGLKHPADGAITLAPALDNGAYTIMSNNGVRASALGPLDIAAIQALYGTPATANHDVAQSWQAATESLIVTGTSGADALFGSGGNDIFFTNGGRDAISGGQGDDTIYAQGNPVTVNGGPGNDTVITGIAYTGPDQIQQSGAVRGIYIPAANDYQLFADVETLSFSNGNYDVASAHFTPISIGIVNITTGELSTVTPDESPPGSPNYLQFQYIYAGSDSLAVSTGLPNVFLHTGAGTDAIQVARGNNVLDGGTGSNFITGGSGTDTFFTDARSPAVVWNTLRNFHAGDSATLWGFTPGISSYRWEDAPAGAPGSEGATLRANIIGGTGRTGDGIDASITFTGISLAEAKSFQIATGTQPAGSYLFLYHG